MKPFSKWTILEVENEFQVKLQRQSALLDSWLNYTDDTIQEPIAALSRLEARLIEHVYDWNEEELKFKFIGPLLDLVDFDQEHYQTFLERIISAPYKNDTLSGNIDFIVAGGKRAPQRLYFFIQEYKRDTDSSGDPLGQLLVSMIAAQILNQTDRPLYGTYVIGRHWYFVVLDKDEYAISLAYDTTKNEIKDIFYILHRAKTIISEAAQIAEEGQSSA